MPEENQNICDVLCISNFSAGRTAEILGEDVKLDLTRLYLARFNEDGEWYRAVPRANVDPNGKVGRSWLCLTLAHS